MLDWDDLRFYLAIARHGSLSAAAKELGRFHIRPESLLLADCRIRQTRIPNHHVPDDQSHFDAIDEQILQLINQRATYAIDVAKTKIAQGEQGTFYRTDRESLVLRRIMELNQGPLPDLTAVRFFRELMSACLALEKPMDIAFLGPEGTFTQQAVFKHFGHAVKTIPVTTINEIFSAVESDKCQFGVVPVENSTEGR